LIKEVQSGNEVKVSSILQHHPNLIRFQSSTLQTPLFAAVMKNNTSMCKILLEDYEAEVNDLEKVGAFLLKKFDIIVIK